MKYRASSNCSRIVPPHPDISHEDFLDEDQGPVVDHSIINFVPLCTVDEIGTKRVEEEKKKLKSKNSRCNNVGNLEMLKASVVDTEPTTTDGGWRPGNVTDPKIQEIGNFSIIQHNRETKEDLQFVSVKQAAYQDTTGRKYSIILTAKDHGVVADYGSIVYENLQKGAKELIAFKKFAS
ncbi:hypothetical protein NE237_002218 [Protea cynaroides]|uniref:Cystatin domain-containing protein n=1 Tax=Protea cynaroides TaxID=273540 RepID=A0A9Q0QYM7_9MAGN|nr:hypothetical protein NE237_001994 [Protea cynaroides]KAJ4977112.1 hypothetical protein NE237_002218 [Protea cynaroides]